MREFFQPVLDFFFQILDFFHTILEPIFGQHSWGWSIVALTLLVRVLLLPLAIKQTRSMRAMQAIQPQVKELQKKYKVDRELMKKDPETYRARRQKLSEEQMALFKREGANPAASCLPLLAQAPIFIALFWMLRGQSIEGGPLFEAPFYFFTSFVSPGEEGATGLAATVSTAGWPGWVLIALMSGSMFITQRQMMARSAAMGNENPMAQQQKILMYVMPVFLAVVSFQFPLGILLYWVTTNVWQIAQQAIILREVKHEADSGELAERPGGSAAGPKKKGSSDPAPRRSPGASSGQKRGATSESDGDGPAGEDAATKGEAAPKGKNAPGQGKDGSKGDGRKGGKAGRGKPGKADADPAAAEAASSGSGGSNGSKPDRSPAGGSTNGSANGRSKADGNGEAAKPGKRDHLPRRRGGAGS